MLLYWKKYRAFAIGLLVLVVLSQLLQLIGLIRINPDDVWINASGFVLYWLAISVVLHRTMGHKTQLMRSALLFSVVMVLLLTLVHFTQHVQDNPLTILMILTFWIGVLYFALPSFFRQYRLPILGLFGLGFLYFLYVRFFSGGYEGYVNAHKDFALLLIMLPVPILLVMWGYEQWKWVRKLRYQQAEAELALLKSQINPHFFFNTLNNLYTLSIQQSERAPEMILKLSDLMRHTLYAGNKETVKIEREKEYLQNFLDLHISRYHHPPQVNFAAEIQDSVDIAPLLFVMLVENAFKHGVEALGADAFVEIHLQSKAGRVQFSIRNNFDPASASSNEGIGLVNLQRRLALIYPAQHQLHITQEGSIFTVELEIENV